jgi:tetraprenyl-beta-curcumene synthase
MFKVLLGAVLRELTWGLPAVAREVRAWRSRSAAIPDAEIRGDALSALASKRGHTEGAALFTILPRSRQPELLCLLVAYELVWDFLDTVNEHGALAGQVNGKRLHLALVEALDPDSPLSDYYRHHPWREDGGYLRALVNACRDRCERLPSYERVRAALRAEAVRAQVLGSNHELDPERRDADLRRWAEQEFGGEQLARWYEMSGAASASLTVHALLALASEPLDSDAHVEQVRNAYFPWISLATTMLDSYVDQVEDLQKGDHSYVSHYCSAAVARQRVKRLVRRCLQEARALPCGDSHALIAGCMVAMYLSRDSAHTRAMRDTSTSLVRAGGSLSLFLRPILRTWRVLYSQHSA